MSVLRRRAILAGTVAATLGAPAIVRRASRLAQGHDQVHRALPARRLDRSGGAHHPGQADRANRLERRGRQQAGRHRRRRRRDRRQVAARRPDLDGHVRQPHPQSALDANLPYKDSELMPRHADRPHARRASRAHPTRPYKTFAEVVKAAKARAGQDQHRRRWAPAWRRSSSPSCRRRTASRSTRSPTRAADRSTRTPWPASPTSRSPASPT